MESYQIPIPNEKAATYKVVTFIISLINLVAFVYVLVGTESNTGILYTIGLLPGIAAVMLFVLQQYMGPGKKPPPAIFLLLSSLCWIFAGIYLVGLTLLVFSVLSLFTIKPLVISFTGEGILYPSFPAKMIEWKDIDFVILKDGILSIELKNNQLMQFTLENTATNNVDAGAFNAYCARQIAG